jgi:hypothetical protein
MLFGLFSTKHGITLQFGFILSIIHKKTNFYSEFYVHLLCELFVELDL